MPWIRCKDYDRGMCRNPDCKYGHHQVHEICGEYPKCPKHDCRYVHAKKEWQKFVDDKLVRPVWYAVDIPARMARASSGT